MSKREALPSRHTLLSGSDTSSSGSSGGVRFLHFLGFELCGSRERQPYRSKAIQPNSVVFIIIIPGLL